MLKDIFVLKGQNTFMKKNPDINRYTNSKKNRKYFIYNEPILFLINDF